jgi:hypothetical protein
MTVRATLGLALLAGLAAWPGGPLAFLPPFLRWPLVVVAVLAYLLLKVPGLHASRSDDNVYFYLATRVAAGEVPYRDFFFTVLYALPGALAVAVAATPSGRRAAARHAAGLVGSIAATLGAAWAAGGQAFLHGVFGFHLARPVEGSRAAVLGAAGPLEAAAGFLHNLLESAPGFRAVYFHAPLALALVATAAVLALSLARRRAGSRDPGVVPAGPSTTRLAVTGLVGAALAVLQAAVLPEVHAFYALPAMPFVALHAPVALARAAGEGRRAAAGVALVLLAAHPLLAALALRRAFPEEMRAAGTIARYAWPDLEVPAPVAGAARALAWRKERVRGRVEPPWRHAVWAKSATFASAREMAALVSARTSEQETVTGASTLAPLVALLAGRRMAAGEADTNAKRFASGSLEETAFLRRILADHAQFVVASPRSFFTEQRLESDPGWASAFERDRVFLDAGLGRGEEVPVLLYRRRGTAHPSPGEPGGTTEPGRGRNGER